MSPCWSNKAQMAVHFGDIQCFQLYNDKHDLHNSLVILGMHQSPLRT